MKRMHELGLGLIAVGSVAVGQSGPPKIPTAVTRLGTGYLKLGEGPDSGKLLPPPPVEGSKALARDKAGEARALKLQGTARWDLAKVDADIFTPNTIAVMSCAAGRVLGVAETPKTSALLRKAASDLGLSSYPAKTMYKRARPFISNGQPVCTPEISALLRTDGSYPSGHAAIGFGWGLILGDVLPKRRSALFKRGAAFADSRRVCNVHFLSDIAAGETLANAVVTKLRANPSYLADVAAAQAELAALAPSLPDCATEKAALKLTR
jgi:acid phosphatase (class A)